MRTRLEWPWLVLLAALSVWVGNRLGELASTSVPLLGKQASMALGPGTLDLLGVLTVHGGLAVHLNVIGGFLGLLTVAWYVRQAGGARGR